MPLLKGDTNDIISTNVREMMKSGHKQDQAVAASMRMAGRSKDEVGMKKAKKKAPHAPKNLGTFLHPKKGVK